MGAQGKKLKKWGRPLSSAYALYHNFDGDDSMKVNIGVWYQDNKSIGKH